MYDDGSFQEPGDRRLFSATLVRVLDIISVHGHNCLKLPPYFITPAILISRVVFLILTPFKTLYLSNFNFSLET